MPRASGTFTPTVGSWYPTTTGAAATKADWNTLLADISSALTQSISADGQTPITANLPLGSFKLTGLGSATLRTDAMNFGQAQDGAYAYLTGVAGTDTITASLSTPALTAYATGMVVRFIAAGTNTGAVTININTLGAKAVTKNGTTALVAGDILSGATYQATYDGTRFQISVYAASGANTDITSLASATTVTTQAAGDNSTKIASTAFVQTAVTLRSYLAGLTMSTAGASATMSIAAGQCADSTNAVQMTLAAIAKTTSAWAVGTAARGLDTGAIANSTWYHFYVIRRPDTGVVDVTFSTNATTPTLPANYTQYRRIGSGRTNGSAQWVLFVQTGDMFLWDAPVLDVSANNPGTAAVTRTLTGPTGVVVEVMFNGGVNNTSNAVDGTPLFSSLLVSDQTPSRTANALLTNAATSTGIGGAVTGHAQLRFLTNTSAQIRSRLFQSDANCTLYVATLGW